MAKYHISDDGMPGACRAKSNDSCPKTQAGDSFHGSLEEATVEAERRFEEKLGAFVTTQKKEEKAEGPKAVGRFENYTAAELRRELDMWDTENPEDDPTDLEIALLNAEEREAETSDEVYVHPQGKTVRISADGTVRAFKDGREINTSATAEKLRAGYGSWKRDYTASKPKVSAEDTEAMMDELTSSESNYERAQKEYTQGIRDRAAYNEANGAKEGRAWYNDYDYSSRNGFSPRKVKGMNPKAGGTQYTPTQAQLEEQFDQKAAFDRAVKWREEAQTNLEEAGLGHKIPDDGKTLRVRTQAQKWLMENELKGQFSDGHWENSGGEGWKDWSETKVIVDPDNAGRNFVAQKDNYNLTHPDLLGAVGDRMVKEVSEKTGKPYDEKAMRADLSDLKKIFKTQRDQVDGS